MSDSRTGFGWCRLVMYIISAIAAWLLADKFVKPEPGLMDVVLAILAFLVLFLIFLWLSRWFCRLVNGGEKSSDHHNDDNSSHSSPDDHNKGTVAGVAAAGVAGATVAGASAQDSQSSGTASSMAARNSDVRTDEGPGLKPAANADHGTHKTKSAGASTKSVGTSTKSGAATKSASSETAVSSASTSGVKLASSRASSSDGGTKKKAGQTSRKTAPKKSETAKPKKAAGTQSAAKSGKPAAKTNKAAGKSSAASKTPSKKTPSKSDHDTAAASAGLLKAPRDGKADDLKQIKGVGPKLEKTCNNLGVYHFDQIAAWKAKDISFIDDQLSFKGRIKRDNWVAQAKKLAKGGETEFSKRVKKGKIYS